MIFEATAVLACVVLIAAGLAITQPEELRPFRWLKIVLSLPLIVLIASLFYRLEGIKGYFALWAVALLGIIWKTPLAHFASLGVARLITGDLNRPTGFCADVAGARALFLDGDLPDAIRYLEQELEKEPLHFEGLRLLSEMYEQADGPKRALEPIKKLLSKAVLTSEQKNLASQRLRKLEERAIVADLNLRK